MPRLEKAWLILLAAALLTFPAEAARKTVCTITVNSADEKDTIRSRLPKGEYDFVELVEKGRPDWLRSSCSRDVQCDVLVISGHFNAGDTFYSDRLDRNEFLEIDELERASCSGSCPGVFSRLKEVYLFGCESLNPEASFNGTGESGRERMRRIFAGVPVIYGFSSSAPVGPTAGMLLNRYFDSGARGEFGSGRPSSRMLRTFSRNSMVSVPGVRDGEPLAAQRGQICRFFDERLATAGKLQFVHRLLRDEGEVRRHFNRIEKLLASVGESERRSGGPAQALARISADASARAGYLAATRRTSQPQLRSRMIAAGASLGWLTPEQKRDEQVAMINDMLSNRQLGFAEVDLACSLNKDGALDGQLSRISGSSAPRATQAAVMACLGDAHAHAQVLKALASPDEKDVQAAQAYLRHRPMQPQELRSVAKDIARMPGAGAAQVRALDTLARQHIADREIIEELSRAFAETRSVNVQRAIAEVFIRSDPAAIPRPRVVATLRQHRLKAPGGAPDLIDTLIARLQ